MPELPLPTDQLEALIVRLEHYEARLGRLRDSRVVFTRLYAHMTRALADQLPERTWQDAGWVVTLGEKFAGRYVAAIDAFDAGQTPSAAWEALQSTMRSRRTSVLQDLIAGMAGHIVHDLPLALCAVGLVEEAGGDRSHVADYHLMNDVLGAAIGPLKLDIERHFDPWLRWLDHVAGKSDDILSNYGIRLSRAAAWYNAVRLLDPAAAEEARDALESSPIALMKQVFDPPSIPVRLLIRLVSQTVSLGRRWPRPAVPAVAASIELPNQRYYFGTGARRWRGAFRYAITDWRVFLKTKLGFWNRMLALGMAVIIAVFQKARIDSVIDAYPDQGPCGVATNDVRVSLLGLPLYVLLEQYALGADGEAVFVRSYERFGPFPFLFNREKKHPAKVTHGGARATYYDMPLLGDLWFGEYEVLDEGRHVESVLTSSWARATESIDRA